MNIEIIKFIHIMLTVSLLGSAFFCVLLSCRGVFLHVINPLMLVLGAGAMLTGTYLVYPNQFTFDTPWIRAAYLLFAGFTGSMLWLIYLKKKRKLTPWIGRFSYCLILTILVLIVHDAVTKSTFLL